VAGVDAHVVKPIKVEHLLSLLERRRAPAAPAAVEPTGPAA